MKYILLFSLIFSNLVYSQEAISLNKDEKAPFTGILINFNDVNDLRKAVIEKDGLKAQNDKLNQIIALQDDNFMHQQKKVGILLEQNDNLALRLGEERTSSTWEKVTYFSLGIIAVIAGGYAIGQVKTTL